MARKSVRHRQKPNGSSLESWEAQAAKRAAEREAEILQLEAERRQQDVKLEARIEERTEFFHVDHEARKRHTAEITRQRVADLPEVDYTAKTLLEAPDEPIIEVIEGLHYRGYNSLLAAEFKTGKTTLAMNLATCLVDGLPFLDRFETNFPYGRVAYLNYELYEKQFKDWLEDLSCENPDRIIPVSLRGWRLPFWEEEWLLRMSQWLLDNRVKFLIIDPAARAWRGLIDNENDNVQMGEFFGAIDELKRLGECPDLLITTHTPRQSEDRARGGGEIEAWPDGNWYLRKKSGQRSLRIEGRMDQPPESFDVIYEESTRRLMAGHSTEERSKEYGVENVVSYLRKNGPTTAKVLKGSLKGSNNNKNGWISEAIERKLVTVKKKGRFRVYEAV